MRVLFVCTQNIARGPMAAAILRELVEANDQYIAESAGTAEDASRRVNTRILAWADLVAVMEPGHLTEIRRHWPEAAHKVRVLGVSDDYDPGEPELREVLTSKVQALLKELKSARSSVRRPRRR